MDTRSIPPIRIKGEIAARISGLCICLSSQRPPLKRFRIDRFAAPLKPSPDTSKSNSTVQIVGANSHTSELLGW